ncbi:MAG: 3'(2'),5'-bisphosphate nucleotidase CysQ [Myxococcales bacterium]|nr:3'(2'),5'-bisphosphate nucleotidase CysQ [Myxococcales bacterium]
MTLVLRAELDVAAALARHAGAAIERVRDEGFVEHEKADSSPVTRADLAADALIREGLRAAYPDDGLLTEESESERVAGTSGRVWVVDPLDGTEAFIDGNVRGYAVQIGLLVDGVPALGVVYEPRADLMLTAAAGAPALAVANGGVPRALAVSKRAELGALRLVTSTTIRAPLKARVLAAGFVDGGGLRSVGVKVGELVRDRADVYLSHHAVHAWDVVAPMAILAAAGGAITDLAGAPFRFDERGHLRPSSGPFLATNGRAHDAAREAILRAWEAP